MQMARYRTGPPRPDCPPTSARAIIAPVTSERLADRWDRGTAYDEFMGRWSRPVAAQFLQWLGVARGAAWLDVGCGTGSLLHTIAAKSGPSELAGVDPSRAFLAIAARGLTTDADLRVGDAEEIPFAPESFDAVVSGLVLNFVPNPAAALAAMRRVCRPGGLVAAYLWDYADGMRFLRLFWDAATALDPAAGALDEGRSRFTLCQPDRLAELFASSGLAEVETTGIEVRRTFAGFDDYWQPFLAGQGPAGTYLVGLADADRSALADELRRRLPMSADGSIRLGARAWAVQGRS